MYQVITIGSALVDIFIHTHQFQVMTTTQGSLLCQTHGGKTEVDNFNVYTGGGAGNTAVGFARLGFKTAAICETGRDNFSYLVIKDLQDQGVATELVVSEKQEQTGGSVVLICADGERSILVHRGAAGQLDPYDISAYWLSRAEVVHLSSLGGNLATLEKIFLAIKKSDHTRLSWNPGKKELELLAEKEIMVKDIPGEFFIVNQEEWSLVASLQPELLDRIKYVVVTAGGKGGTIYQQGQLACQFPALSTRVVDATGAGDAFAVGFVTGIQWGKTVDEAAYMGALNSASVVGAYGAKPGLLQKGQLENALVSFTGKTTDNLENMIQR